MTAWDKVYRARDRDRKRGSREKSKRMRGNRSVFAIQQSIGKRAKEARNAAKRP